MRKVISFSLFGEDPKYLHGALENAELAKTYYPGWEVQFRVDVDTVPREVIERLSRASTVILKRHCEDGKMKAWRALPAGDEDVDVVISRDADSRLNPRGAAATEEWLSTGRLCHIMRDHAHHCGHEIMGGMWGARDRALVEVIPRMFNQWIQWYGKRGWQHSTDILFLSAAVFDQFTEDEICHHADPKTCQKAYRKWRCRPFPKHEPYDGFVGEIVER